MITWCVSILKFRQVSTFGHCEYTSLNLNPSDCASVGGSFNGLAYAPFVKTRCLAPALTQDTCYDPQYCSSSTVCYRQATAKQLLM